MYTVVHKITHYIHFLQFREGDEIRKICNANMDREDTPLSSGTNITLIASVVADKSAANVGNMMKECYCLL